MKNIQIPYGISSYDKFIKNNYLYIDKSVAKELSNLMDTLQNNYNGYLFSERCETRLFNLEELF